MTTVDKNSGVEFSNTMYQWKAIALVSIVMAHSWYGIYCFHQIVINCVMRSAFNKENLLQWGIAYLVIATISCLIGYALEKAEKRLIA